MIRDKLGQQRGITLLTLSVAIVIMIVISSTLIYNATVEANLRKLNNLYNDIGILQDKVMLYYSKNLELPIISELYKDVENIKNINPNDNGKYYVIDLELLENLSLTYGREYTNYKQEQLEDYKDIYIINEQSHKVYYIKGIPYNNKMYYTIPEENTKVDYTSVLNIEKIEEKQDSFTIKFSAVDKQKGISKINLYVDDNLYKTYTYEHNIKELKQEVEVIKIPFDKPVICYFEVIDENGNNIAKSENLNLVATNKLLSEYNKI